MGLKVRVRLGLQLNFVRDGLGINDGAGVGIWLSDGPWVGRVWTWEQ